MTTRLENCRRAYWSWHRRAAQFRGEPHPRDFAAGFRQGYCDVANGEDGCPPPLPPRVYWASRFENPNGRARIAAWFAGYPCGAQAAEEEAAGIFRPIPASAEIRHHYEMRHAPPQPTAAEFLEAVPARAAEPDSPPGSEPLLPTPVRAADETASREHVTADIERRVAAREDGPAASAPLPGQIWTPATLHRR
ncbi:MAG: hypothetical protein KJ000_04160 [Pirellulaceae bacterium]|nr:hypothetical protein [Pirellulaceae bacterium]